MAITEHETSQAESFSGTHEETGGRYNSRADPLAEVNPTGVTR